MNFVNWLIGLATGIVIGYFKATLPLAFVAGALSMIIVVVVGRVYRTRKRSKMW